MNVAKTREMTVSTSTWAPTDCAVGPGLWEVQLVQQLVMWSLSPGLLIAPSTLGSIATRRIVASWVSSKIKRDWFILEKMSDQND